MIGLELEWADVDRHMLLPPELGTWNDKDYTIVNSDGHANSPDGSKWRWGGEINTRPTETAAEQSDIVRELARLLNPTINYKCNLHVHVSPPEWLKKDVKRLQEVARYLRAAEQVVYSLVDPIVRPTETEFPYPEEFAGAKRRHRRTVVSHHYQLPAARWAEMMEATTPEEFYDAHAAPRWSRNGEIVGRSWHLAQRAGMNLRSLWKHGTIEYRHFYGTSSPEQVESAAEWCRMITEESMLFRPRSAQELYDTRRWHFPRPVRYEHRLALGFQETRYK